MMKKQIFESLLGTAILSIGISGVANAVPTFYYVSPQLGYTGRIYDTVPVSVNANGTQASARETSVSASGHLTTNVGVEAGGSSRFTVHGVNPNTPITFDWRITGSRSEVLDDSTFQMYFNFGANSPNPTNGGAFEFAGLSYVDNAPGAGNFAGTLTGGFGCLGSSTANAVCGTTWNGLGSLGITESFDYSDGSEGGLYFALSIAGTGANTQADYTLELISVTVPNGSFFFDPLAAPFASSAPTTGSTHYLEFDTGLRVDIQNASAITVPEPGTGLLLFTGLGAVAALRRRRAMQPG